MDPRLVFELDRHFGILPESRGRPASREEVASLERRVGVRLPDDYRDFLTSYGPSVVGSFPVFGVGGPAEMMVDEGYSNPDPVIALEGLSRRGFDIPPGSFLVSVDDDNPLVIGAEGTVDMIDYDTAGGRLVYALSFADFLRLAQEG